MSTTPTPPPDTKAPVTFADFERQRGTVPTGALAPESQEPPVVTDAPAGEGAPKPPEPKAAEPSGDSEPKADAEDKTDKPPRGGFQRRIDTLTREKYELHGRIAELERQLAARNGQPGSQPAGKQPATGTDTASPKPKLEDFKTWEDYNEALTDWKADQKITAALAQHDAEQQQKQVATQFEQRINQATAKHGDFLEVAALVPANDAIAQFMLRREHGPEVVYYLGQNPDELARVTGLTDRFDITAELLRIEGIVSGASAKPEPTKPAVSRAPKPPVQVAPTSLPTAKSPAEAGSFEEYVELRRPKR